MYLLLVGATKPEASVEVGRAPRTMRSRLRRRPRLPPRRGGWKREHHRQSSPRWARRRWWGGYGCTRRHNTSTSARHCPALRKGCCSGWRWDEVVPWQPAVHHLRAVNRCKSIPTCLEYTWELICVVFNVLNWLIPVSAEKTIQTSSNQLRYTSCPSLKVYLVQ